MNNKLRQEILKEIKFLLNEQEEAEQGVFGGTFSEDLDDILEDINDANIKEIAGFSYIDLTTMEDSTDEGELNLLVKSFKDVSDSSEIIDPDAQKAIEKVCSTNILLINSVGRTDTYFYVSCKQTSDSKLRVPVSAKKIGLQGQEAAFPGIIKKIKQGSTSTPTSSEADKFCGDKADNTPVPQNISGIMQNLVCKDKKAVDAGQQPVPSPAPVPQGQIGAQGKNSFKCKNKEDVAVFQQWLRVKEDCSVGIQTITAAKSKGLKLNLEDYFSAEGLSQKQIQNQFEFCNSLRTNRGGYEAEIKKSGQEVRGKCPVAVSPAIEESKNFYDNKKLNEAKQLFDKLLKKL